MIKLLIYISACLILSAAQKSETRCSETQFRCDNGHCVDSKCNGAIDCPDGSDEDFVLCRTSACRNDQFQCVYGACVTANATCDGKKDCADNSDELLLECRNEHTYFSCLAEVINTANVFKPVESVENCGLKERTCKDGQLIEIQQKCDGIAHCKDGSDESLETCATNRCLKVSFRCKNGGCMHASVKCNGVNDCADGSDELEQLCHYNNKGLCVLPAFPKNGYYSTMDFANVIYPGQALESVQLNFSCHTGYKLVGSQYLFCNKGWWSDTTAKCVSQCLLNKHPSVEYECIPKNSSSHEGARECDDLVEHGTAVRPKCREPNYYYSGLLANMHCSDGVWDQVFVCSPQCGLVTSEGEQLVVGGRNAKRGELPWHAGIYKKTTQPYMQICGGSLISNTVVISAAHCFWTSLNKQLSASYFAVAVGKLYRPWNNPNDEDAQKSDVLDIKIPARFQGAAANFQEDIAIVIVASPFEFRTYVRPVCVDFDYNFSRRQLRVGATGKVAGWGLTTEDGVAAPVLQVVDLPYVEIEECISASPAGFIEYITSDKICAGVINGTMRSVCKGDSGGGLAFKAIERGAERYFLRGVASTSPTNDHLCNAGIYTTFTQVTKHEEFIKKYFRF